MSTLSAVEASLGRMLKNSTPLDVVYIGPGVVDLFRDPPGTVIEVPAGGEPGSKADR